MKQELAKHQTAQHQLASALAEIFEGKTFRYWKKGKETWFVAKDLVEAAGGSWHPQNFKSVVGEGAYTISPLEINGISQDVLACPAKTAVRWLSVSRLPSAEGLADLVFDIIGRVMDGEEVNAMHRHAHATQLPPSTDLGRAASEIKEVMDPLLTVFDAIGLSKAEKSKAYVEHAMTIGPKHGVGNQLIPAAMAKYLPTGKSSSLVAMASTGGEIVDVTKLGVILGGYTGAEVNNMLVHIKFQAKIKLGSSTYYVKLPAADAIADEKEQKPRRAGQYAPTKIIKGWRENLVYPHLQRIVDEHPEHDFWR